MKCHCIVASTFANTLFLHHSPLNFASILGYFGFWVDLCFLIAAHVAIPTSIVIVHAFLNKFFIEWCPLKCDLQFLDQINNIIITCIMSIDWVENEQPPKWSVLLCVIVPPLSYVKSPKMNYSQGIEFVSPQSPHNSQILSKVFHAQDVLEQSFGLWIMWWMRTLKTTF